MTNFDYFKKEKKFDSFVDVAIVAEKIIYIDTATSVVNCRRAMEFAIKWLYSVDSSLEMPYQDNLSSLMGSEDFHDLLDDGLWKRLDLIRKKGNKAAHNGKKVVFDEAVLCLKNLHTFFDFIFYCYSPHYEEKPFDEQLLETHKEVPVAKPEIENVDLKALIEENKALKEQLTQQRKAKEESYVPKPLELSEYKTRKIYIDSMLEDAGWVEGKDWLNEVQLLGMNNKSGVGYADYVLYDDAHRPLAIIEAKKTCADAAKGRQQAKLYADIIEQQYGRRPVVFLTNGFDTRIIDNQYPERKIAAIYSKRDLEKLFNLQSIDLYKKVSGIASVANIPEIQNQKELIEKILQTDYVDHAGIEDFEHIRKQLRDLIKYIPKVKLHYETDFTDNILSSEWNESELENDELKNYKAKAEYYIRKHQDNIVIAKLKNNKPLTSTDVEALEDILWKEVGTREDYEKEYGHKPLGEFVRSIVGLDMNAAKEAFSHFLDGSSFNSRQIYFVNQIVEYIVRNGMLTDLSVLQESPFTDQGSVDEIFTDMTVWQGIRGVIDQINGNAVA